MSWVHGPKLDSDFGTTDGFTIVGHPFLGQHHFDHINFPSFFLACWRYAGPIALRVRSAYSGDPPASKRGIPIDGDP